jgi:hypothetical protein
MGAHWKVEHTTRRSSNLEALPATINAADYIGAGKDINFMKPADILVLDKTLRKHCSSSLHYTP